VIEPEHVNNSDLLTILCCVLRETGPVEFTTEDQVSADHNLLELHKVTDPVNFNDKWIVSHGEFTP